MKNNTMGAKAPHIIGIDPGVRNIGFVFTKGYRIISKRTFKDEYQMLLALILHAKKFHPIIILEDILLYRPNANAKRILELIGKIEFVCQVQSCQLIRYIPLMKDKVKITPEIERKLNKLKDEHQRDAYLLICYYVQNELNSFL